MSTPDKPQQVTDVEQLETVVDTDFHITEKEDDFLPYLEGPFKKVLQRGSEIDQGLFDQINSLYPSAGLFTPVTTGKVQPESVTSKEDVREGMELLGDDRVIVTPTLNLYLGCVGHDDLADALARAYNEWILDKIVDVDKGIYAAAVASPHHPENAAEEIDDRADEPGIVGAFLPSGGNIPLLGNEKYHPLYDACQENDLPVMMHNASGNMMMDFPLKFQLFDRFLPKHAVSHSMIHMCNMADMLTNGIPVRFPDLEFVIQEAGVGYIPYFLKRFDHEYHAKKEDAPMLEREPSEYILDQFYFTSQPAEGVDDPKYINNMVRLFEGESNLMFSSDYPHLDFDESNELLTSLTDFGDDEIENVYGQTALEVYDF